MPVGMIETFNIELRLPADAHYWRRTRCICYAFVSSANPDPNVTNNVSGRTIAIPVQAEATLSIAKTLLNDFVATGGTAFYEIVVCNSGPSDIRRIGVLDTPGQNLVGATVVTSSDADDLYLPAGQCRDVMAAVQIDPAAAQGDTFTNAVETDSANADGGPGSTLPPVVVDDSASVDGTVGFYLPPADMDATTTIVPLNTPVAGQVYTFEIHVDEQRPGARRGRDGSSHLRRAARRLAGDGPAEPGRWQLVLRWPRATTARAWGRCRCGGRAVATYNILLPPDAVSSRLLLGLVFHELTVTADNPDPFLVNNLLFVPAQVLGEATLQVQKADLKDPLGKGEDLIYELVVRNQGPSTLPAGSVRVRDQLPPEVRFRGASPECSHDGAPLGGVVTCRVPIDMQPNDTYDFLIEVSIDDDVVPPVTITNRVAADAPGLNPAIWTVTPAQDTETTDIVGGPYADLKLTKVVKPDESVYAGDVFYYWLFVDNLGPDPAVNVVLNDTMMSQGPFEVLAIQGDRPGGACVPPAGPATQNGVGGYEFIFNCTLPILQENDRWTVLVSARATETIDVNNVATVRADTEDLDLTNNMAMQAINVIDVADLALEKAAISSPVTAGETAEWLVTVSNGGPSTATNVRVYDVLPAGLVDGSVEVVGPTLVNTLGADVGPQGSCTLGTPGDPLDPMVCDLGTLPAPDANGRWSIRFRILGDVDPSFVVDQPNSQFADFVDNDAWVTSDVLDLDNSNNRGQRLRGSGRPGRPAGVQERRSRSGGGGQVPQLRGHRQQRRPVDGRGRCDGGSSAAGRDVRLGGGDRRWREPGVRVHGRRPHRGL